MVSPNLRVPHATTRAARDRRNCAAAGGTRGQRSDGAVVEQPGRCRPSNTKQLATHAGPLGFRWCLSRFGGWLRRVTQRLLLIETVARLQYCANGWRTRQKRSNCFGSRLAADDRRRPAHDDWALFIAEVLRLEGVLSQLNGHVGAEIAAAAQPLADRFRAVGMGGVQKAAREILKCWTRLESLTGPIADLREWEREWAPTRVIDARTFDAVLANFAGASSHVWCNFYARLPRSGVYEAEAVKDVRHNLWRALRFVFETGVVLTRIRGTDSLPPYWRDVTDTYNDRLAAQYHGQPLDQEPSTVGAPPTAIN